MKKWWLLLLCFCWNYASAWAQENETDKVKSKWLYQPSAGVNLPLTRMLKGHIADNLIEYADRSVYWQVLSTSYFFKPHLGVEVSLTGSYASSLSLNGNRFAEELFRQYSHDYFIDNRNGLEYLEFNIFTGTIARGVVGPVYRVEKGKMIFMPRLLFGFTSFYTNWAAVYLKEKDTNNAYTIRYSPNKIPQDHITWCPSMALGYRLSNRLFLNLDLVYSYYRTNFSYTEEITDLYSLDKVVNLYQYKRPVHMLSVGAGIGYGLK